MATMRCPETSSTRPMRAIRLKCMDCSGQLRKEVEFCPVKHCPLYPYRFGKNPFRMDAKITERNSEFLDGDDDGDTAE